MTGAEPAPAAAAEPGPPRPGAAEPDLPYGHQWIDDDDVVAVAAVLRSDRLTQGPQVEAFEARLRTVTGAAHAVAFCNGTAALHAACAVTGLGPGHRVVTSDLTFVASANCIRYVGAEPVVVDVDAATWNLDVGQIDDDLDGLVAVHFAGLPLDLAGLAGRPRVVIEDAAHALGARTPDGPVGNCARSDACCFSFHPVKAVTTGEGGAVTTNDADLAEALRRFRNHGMVPEPEVAGWAYDVRGPGWNYRLTDLQAALGHSQLGKLERFIERRGALAERYRRLLDDVPVGLPPAAPPGWRHAYHLFPVEVDERNRVFAGMRSAGIGVQLHYIPVHHHTYYAEVARRGPLGRTERLSSRLLSLPIFPGMTDHDQDRVIATLGGLL